MEPASKTGRSLWPRLVLVVLLGAAVAAFFALGLDQRLTLAGLKTSAGELGQWVEANPLAALAAYFAAYVAVTGLGLPGAAAMSLGAGALFGFLRGVVLVSFASTLGATLSCLVARYLLRGWVAARFGARLAAVDQGVAREGAFYLFTMRLIPALPFWAVNLLMGLTPMPARTFAWVSQAGMLPATLVFVYAGTRLAQVDSLSGVLSPGLLAAFALLGLLPLAARLLVRRLRAKRQA